MPIVPRPLTALKVFISGTDETDAERGALASIVGDLNEILEKTHGVILRTVAWPDSFRPGVGNDPQGAVNQQVGSDYDIYVGILGARFGTPTSRAGSGTEEEFNIALERFRDDAASVRILFYFKRSAEDPFRIDPDQLKRILQFRDSLSKRGVLYRDFVDTQNFAELARKHLHNLIVDEWNTTCWRQVPNTPTVQQDKMPNSDILMMANASESMLGVPDDTSDDGEELGLIEATEELGNTSNRLTIVLERMSGHVKVLSVSFEERTADTNRLTELAQSQPLIGGKVGADVTRSYKEVADQVAEDLEHFAIQMALEIEVFANTTDAFFEQVSRVRRIRTEFSTSTAQVDTEREELKNFVENITSSQANTASFQNIITRLPALTTKVRKARRSASLVLGKLVAELQKSQSRGRQLLDEDEGNKGESPV